MKFVDFLYTPFPRPEKNRKNLALLILVGLAASLFILIYNPFNIRTDTGQWYLDLVIFGLGVLFILSVLFLEVLVPKLFPGPFKKWTLGKALIWYAIVIVFIAAANFMYKSAWGNFNEFSWSDFLLVLGRTMVISFTVCFFVLGIWQYLNRNKISSLLANETYTVETLNGKSVALRLNDILFIRSDDNYVDVHYLSEGKRNKIVLRSSLKNIESQVVNRFSPIIRCHRQYLINTRFFQIKNQSSRSMLLSLKKNEDQVPVSKQFVKQVKKNLSVNPN
ncbi:MAG: LytTR family transcriptional regulator [Bacteroidia bacterium]|nr:LytTR family transcriptional regulator [Bacteroidia bacterium]